MLLEEQIIVHQEVTSTISQTREKVVQIGSVVTFVDEYGNRFTYKISSTSTMQAEGKEISILSPVGKALFGSKLGNKVKVSAPKGEYQIEVVDLE